MTWQQAQMIVAAHAPPRKIEHGSTYDRYRKGETAYLPTLEVLLDEREPADTLDVGPGWGTVMLMLAARHHCVSVCDKAPLGRYLTPDLLESADAVYHHVDIEDPLLQPLSDGGRTIDGRRFDLVLMTQVIPHLRWSPDGALANVRRLMADGGEFICCVLDRGRHRPVKTVFTDWYSVPSYGSAKMSWGGRPVVTMYDEPELRDLLSCEFSKVEVWAAEKPILFARCRP